MVRVTVLSAFLALVLQAASAQILSTGAPASALSPRPDGLQNGIPAGATSPRPLPPGVNRPLRHFDPGHVDQLVRPFGSNHHRAIVPQVPLFYPIYGYPTYGAGYDYYANPSVADPAVSQEVQPEAQAEATARSEDALRQAYMKGAHDALVEEQRGRQEAHDYVASHTKPPAPPKQPVADAPAPAPEPDDSPSTVFIFKDGRQIETKNFAIMGQTLYDLSTGVVRKVQLAELDKPATLQANDERGITVKLP